MGKMFLRDTDSRIGHLEQDTSILLGKPESDRSSGSGEFQCVPQDVYENLPKFCGIHIYLRILYFRSVFTNERKSTLLCKKRQPFHHRAGDFLRRDGFILEFHFS